MARAEIPRWDSDSLRSTFTIKLSEMYRNEVPAYGSLVDIVRRVDSLTLAAQGLEHDSLPVRHELERHGAIRLGTEYELHTVKRLFSLLGMHPVGYYDLTAVGFPMHATAFRPIDDEALRVNPFRVFTTVLRRDRLSEGIREKVDNILSRRNLFSSRLLNIIERAESKDPMTADDAADLISEALKIFKWHSKALVTTQEYMQLRSEHPMVADIVCFPSAHINHLTPRTLNIDLVHESMLTEGLPAKERIEGPPNRKCSILLRQTSFKALEEKVIFVDQSGEEVQGTHTARFGEVEQRGAAVTVKGRKLYDRLLSEAMKELGTYSKDASDFGNILSRVFSVYPDTWSELRSEGLVYFKYTVMPHNEKDEVVEKLALQPQINMAQLLSLGLVQYEPITYEDFLPLSAAGIFRSNLNNEKDLEQGQGSGQVSELEHMLGCKIKDEFEIYSATERRSIHACAKELGLQEIRLP